MGKKKKKSPAKKKETVDFPQPVFCPDCTPSQSLPIKVKIDELTGKFIRCPRCAGHGIVML